MATALGDPPKVSVIVRTKDRPDLLTEALESLRTQTFTDFETLVVNDDGALSDAALSPTPGRDLRIVRPEPPGGRVRALNAGLAAARGTYISYLDDDDVYREAHLGKLVAALEEERDFGAAFSGVDQISQHRGPDGRWQDGELLFHYGRPFDADRILFKNDLPLIALLHRRDLVEKIGPFDTAFDLFEDWDFLIRLSRVTRFLHVPETTAVYRVRNDDSNATRAHPWQGPVAEEMRRALFAKHASLRTIEATMAAVDGLDGDVWLREQEARTLRERLDDAEERLRESGVRLAETESRLGEAAVRFSRLEALFKEECSADRRRLEEAKIREAALTVERDALGAELWKIQHSLWWRLGRPWWKLRSLFRK